MRKPLTLAIAVILFIPAVLLLALALAFEGIRWLNRNHERASESVRDVAKASRVLASFAAFWAWLVAPTGLAAVGASLGIVSTPLIVVFAPVLVAIAGAALTVSAMLELYSKWLKRRALRH